MMLRGQRVIGIALRTLAAFCLLLLLSTCDPANGAYTFVRTIGSYGTGNGQFQQANGVVIDSAGNIVVTDYGAVGNGRIVQFSNVGTFVRNIGQGRLRGPNSSDVDSEGNIFVSDNWNYRIVVFDNTGALVRTFGSRGNGDGQFGSSGPAGVVLDAQGNVWVADPGGCRIVGFDKQGNFLRAFGGPGSGDGQFNYPFGMAVDSQGNLLVGDASNNRVVQVDQHGTFLKTFGIPGAEEGQLKYPTGVAVDSHGNIWVADTANSRIQKFTHDGDFLETFGEFGSGNGQFKYPYGVDIDSAGNVYVADTFNNRIQVFAPNLPPVADAGPDQTVGCTGELTEVHLDGTASYDPEGDPLEFEWSVPEKSGAVLDDPYSPVPSGLFPIGPTLVTLTVTDGEGNFSCDDVLITVEDTQPPVLVCTTDKISLWPPNHQMVPVNIYVQVSDNSGSDFLNDGPLMAVVSSSEPDDGTGDGAFTGDVDGADGHGEGVPVMLQYDEVEGCHVGTVMLRAERDGSESGRVYSIACEVVDGSDNVATASCVVVVPHDKKKK